MPKSRKQKRSVKKKKKPSPRKSKPRARRRKFNEDVPIIPFLEPTTEDESTLAELEAMQIRTSPRFSNIAEKEIEMEDIADVSEERASIISIVNGLEGQVETAFKLKEVLEAELDTAQNKLSEELDARAQLEAQVESLEARAALAEQLREDISFAEEERNKFVNLLAQTQPQLEEVTAERDSLAEQMASTKTDVKELEGEKMALGAQVMNLKDKITDADRLRKELAEITEAHRGSREQVHDLTRRLKASEVSKNALEKELAGTHQNARTLRAVVEKLQKKVAGADGRVADLRIQLKDQQAANRELMETNTRLENEIKMVNINCEVAKSEVDAFKNAMRDIRSEATRTSGRVRQRYFNAGNSNKKVRNSASRKRKRSQALSTKA
ncbi:Chromosome partition protein Smc [subsurface metagenome]